MAARVLSAEKHWDGYRVTVHLDESRVLTASEAKEKGLPAGDPHPDYVREWTWGLPQGTRAPLHENGGHSENGAFHHAAHTQYGADLTEAAYLENILAMLPEMVRNELNMLAATRPQLAAPVRIAALHGAKVGG